MRRILIDSGVLLSYYQQQEPLHQAVLPSLIRTPRN
jgi:hypothetical protein